MTIEAGDRVRYDAATRRHLRRSDDYTGIVGEVDDSDQWAWVSWNGGETFGWTPTSNLEVAP